MRQWTSLPPPTPITHGGRSSVDDPPLCSVPPRTPYGAGLSDRPDTIQYGALARVAGAPHSGTTRCRSSLPPYTYTTPVRARSIKNTATHPFSTTQIKDIATDLDILYLNLLRSEATVKQAPWKLSLTRVTQQQVINNAGNY